MTNTTNAVRILLIGEPRVGKTTLILSLVREEFSLKVPAQAEEITIPADVTPERIPTQIVDYSSQTQSNFQLLAEIKRANVICLVHALDDENSFKQISSYWLPLIRHTCADANSSTPIVLVGNKLDIKHESKLDKMLPIMSEFSEVETCIECSAKNMLNLSEIFWFAQKAVLYPTAPLYKAETKELTFGCISALTRIFRICDIDNDGYMSDRELEAFQTRCFSIPLTSQSLEDVKHLVHQSCSGGINLNGLTLKGFLFLHSMFIQKGRHETTWTVLRQFGYGNHMRLSEEFISPKFSISVGCSMEISLLGLQFLNTLFNKYDLDHDGCLSPVELSELLATCPEGQLSSVVDMAVCVTTNSIGWLTRQGFIAFWILTAYLEPNRLLEYFAYLGFTYYAAGSYWHSNGINSNVNGGFYTNNLGHTLDVANLDTMTRNSEDLSVIHNTTFARRQTSFVSNRSDQNSCGLGLGLGLAMNNASEALLKAIIITKDKRLDNIRRSTQRTVFYCRVYGARKVGKTCLLQGLLGRSLHGSNGSGIGGVHGRTTNWVGACGIPVYGQSRTMLMQEISSESSERMSANEALSADVACLVYDVSDPDSFRFVANLFLNFYRGTRVPCLLVAAKSDQSHVIQNYQLDPSELAVKYHLSPPEPFSSIHLPELHRKPLSDTILNYTNNLPTSRHNRVSSADPFAPKISLGQGEDLIRNPFSAENLISLDRSPNEDFDRHNRRYSHSKMYDQTPFKNNLESDDQKFAPVFMLLCAMANYPHHRGFELARTDHAWKWTLAATILAGFGFVAFKIAKTHL